MSQNLEGMFEEWRQRRAAKRVKSISARSQPSMDD